MSNSTATANSIDPNVLSAIIAAVVAFIILFLDRYFIEPRIWRKRNEILSLEKTLEVYGSLVTILKSCNYRAFMQNGARPTDLYNVDRHDIGELEVIFERKGYLLSNELRKEWETLHGNQSHLGQLKQGTFTDLNLPLKRMKELAEGDFKKYNERYAKLTGSNS